MWTCVNCDRTRLEKRTDLANFPAREYKGGIMVRCPVCNIEHYLSETNNPSLKEVINNIKGTVK